MPLPLRNQEACLWALYWASWDEWLFYNRNASERTKQDARTAIKQDLGLMHVVPAR